MKKTILINVLSLLFAFTGRSQQTLFDSIYYNNSSTLNEELESAVGITSIQNSYYSLIRGLNVNTNKRISFISKIDSVGNEINRYVFKNDNQYNYNSSSICSSTNKIFVTGTYLNSANPDTGKLFVLIFNDELDSLSFNTYTFLLKTGSISQIIFDGNKYIYGIGFCTDLGSYGDLFVTKLDTIGNLIWNKKFGLITRNEGSCTIQLIGNDSLFIGGLSNEGANGSSGIALLLDTAGIQHWMRYIDLPGKENIFGGGFHHSDGGFAMVGSYYLPPNGESELCFTKLNSSGIRVYDRFYSLGIKSEGTDYCFFDDKDSTIVAVGGNLNVPQYHEAALAVKYSLNGDTIWTRTFDKSYNINGAIDHFYDVIATSDGGYLFAGQTRSGIIGIQDAWLLKTDSIGCHPNYPCWPVSHVIGLSQQQLLNTGVNFSIFPNPFTTNICIKFKHIYQNNFCKLKLYNTMGQLVKEQIDYNLNPIVILKTEEVEPGMYILEIETLYATERIKILKE
jgi:hypothetical protein